MGRKRVSIGPTSHMDVKLEAMKKPSLIESEAQEGGHEQEVLDGSSDAQETQMDASFNGDSDSHFTDLECLKIYCTLTSWQEFNNALPGIMHENFVRGSMRANGGTLPCFKCHRNFSSPLDIISHLRKCRKRVMKCIAETPVPELAGPHVKRKPVAKRTINFDISVASLDELKHEPSLWLQLTPTEKLDVLKLIFPGRDVECFAIRPSGQKCPTFNDYKRAIAHLDACVQPMYLTYVGERASEFRLLDKKVRARYVREGMAMCVQLPCIECGRLFTHHYGLLYHVERCNVSVDEMPWKCYRCGFQTKRSKSQEHLRDCWGSEREQQDAPQEPATPVMGTLGDVNLRSGKAILKEVDGVIEIGGVKKMVNEINAEEAIKSILGSNKSILTPRRRRSAGGGRASVSAGVIPETSTRLTVSGDGKMRFKFRKADAKAGVAGMSGYPRYLEQVQKSHELWREEVTALPYCSRLSDIQPAVWEATSNSSELPFASKESVGLRVHEEWDVEHIDVPQSCRRIRCLSSTELFNETNESVTVAYCGGPINAIRVAPNTMSNGDDVVAVVTYPCEITLVGKDMRSADGFVQFWIHSCVDDRPMLTPWFVLKSNYGLVFDLCWLDRPRPPGDDTLIGYFALSTAQGVVLIYRLDTTTIPQKSPESTIVPVVSPEPSLVLTQAMTLFNKPDGQTAEPTYPPPVHNLTWTSRDAAQYVVGVNAAGGAVIWDLQRSVDTPQVLLDPTWSSPVTYAVFVGEHEVALSFRERVVRVYNVRTYECSLEENAVRTAGARVSAQQRLFSGCFTYQAEYFSSGEVPTNGVSFICRQTKSGAYFVVPLANRHTLMTWDVAACAGNAVVASCGVDGRLILSANGRLVSTASTVDFGFCMGKAALMLSRRRVSPPEAVNIGSLFSQQEGQDDFDDAPSGKDGAVKRPACPTYSTHEEAVGNLWLDVCMNPDSQGTRNRLEYSALDMRIESLNCVATNNSEKAFVFTGGQAGLMFVRPCVIDTELTALNELFNGSSTGKKKKKRPRVVEEEDDDDEDPNDY